MSTKEKQPNAQKWTREIVEKYLDEIGKEAEDVIRPFLGQALKKRGLQRHVWSYWKRTFADEEDMMERMLEIESMFEVRLVEMALHKQINPTIAVRTLRFVYKWGKGNREW
jgi:hypothetical protein